MCTSCSYYSKAADMQIFSSNERFYAMSVSTGTCTQQVYGVLAIFYNYFEVLSIHKGQAVLMVTWPAHSLPVTNGGNVQMLEKLPT